MSDRKQTPDVLADLLGGEMSRDVSDDFLIPAAPARPRLPKHTTPSEPQTIRAPRDVPARLLMCWEHRVASFQQHKGWRLRYLDGVQVQNWASGPRLHETIATLAADGWQVAGVCSGEALFGLLDKYQVFFKRPAS